MSTWRIQFRESQAVLVNPAVKTDKIIRNHILNRLRELGYFT